MFSTSKAGALLHIVGILHILTGREPSVSDSRRDLLTGRPLAWFYGWSSAVLRKNEGVPELGSRFSRRTIGSASPFWVKPFVQVGFRTPWELQGSSSRGWGIKNKATHTLISYRSVS